MSLSGATGAIDQHGASRLMARAGQPAAGTGARVTRRAASGPDAGAGPAGIRRAPRADGDGLDATPERRS